MIKKFKRGFTLIETVVVMVVLGILMVATVVGASSYINKANTSNTKGDISGLNTIAKSVFYEVYTIDPPNAEAFLQGGKYENYFVGDMELVDNTSATDSIVFTKTITDAWKQPYQVKFEKDKDISGVKGIENGKYDYAFTFTSGGKDKKIDGKDDIVSIVAIKDAVISSAFVEKASSETSKPAPAPDPKPDLIPVDGRSYTQGDYEYTYYSSLNGWSVRAVDKTKSSYGEILSTIGGKPVIHMLSTFEDCRSLVTAPAIPNSVTNMGYTFTNCISLVTAPVIPSNVTAMSRTFANCKKLIVAPAIPDSVINMNDTFYGCTSLVNAPVIPHSVTNMWGTFNGCTSLINAPTIPNNVTNMGYTFNSCTSLINAPVIPHSVTNMTGTFECCTNLAGDLTIKANLTDYTNYKNMFSNAVTTGKLTIHCTTENKSEIDIVASKNRNITVVADAK